MPLLFHMVSEALPRLISPLLQNAPDAVAANLASIDLFDGFGNAGMAQPPPQMPFSLEEEGFPLGPDYEKKFSPAEYERKFAMGEVGGGSTSPESSGASGTVQAHSTPPDMGNSFTTSPPMMSPGVEFQPGMNEFSGFPEMMMQRMGGQQGQCQMPMQGQGMQHMHGAPNQCQSPTGMGVNGQGMPGRPLGQSPGMGNPPPQMMGRQKGMPGMHVLHGGLPPGGGMAAQLQRSGSFVGHPPGVRTVGEFHAMQRVSFSCV